MTRHQTESLTEKALHPALRGLYQRIEQMDFHATRGLHGAEETRALLNAIWKENQFRTLVELLDLKSATVVPSYGGSCSVSLGVDSKGFYTLCDTFGDGNPDGIKIERNIGKISEQYDPQTVKIGLTTFIRYAL